MTDGSDDGEIAADRVALIHDHLAATRELPVERTASRWIGEAEAVAGDLAGADVDTAVLERRLDHVADLLENVEGTEDATAAEHVAAARELTAALLDDLEAGDGGDGR